MKEIKLIEPGKWYKEFDENGNCVAAVYDASYRKLIGFEDGEEYDGSAKARAAVIHPEDRERFDAHWAECFAKDPQGKDLGIEYRMMTKNGYHWFYDYAHISRRGDGSAIRADGIVFDVDESKSQSTILAHESLKSEIFSYIIDNDDDPIELLKKFAERIRVLIDCDQVIYRDLEETRIMVNSPAIEKTWAVPIEYCMQCEHFDAHHPMYAGGYTEMSNCQKGWQGIPVYEKCPIKSSLTRIVYCDGKVAGYLAIHYVQKYHEFTDAERVTLEEFTRILSLSLSRYNAKRENLELRSKEELANKLQQALTFTNYFLGTYESAYYINFKDLSYQIYRRAEKIEAEYPIIDNYLESITAHIKNAVHPDDIDGVLELIQPENMRSLLREKSEISHTFRDISGEKEKIINIQIIRGTNEDHAAFGFKDITAEYHFQQQRMLGAVPVSPDILNKANIGLWAFELDEGKTPRMYVDDTMLRLLGLDHHVTPEETYHAWYDHVDEKSYDLVAEAVENMKTEHAEVQYPWHHPNGATFVVRCGGVRNFEYKAGIRIEGTHQNVSEVIRYDKEEAERNRKASEFDSVRRSLNMFFSLSNQYDPIIVVDPETGEYDWLMSVAQDVVDNTSMTLHGENLYKNIGIDSESIIHEDDREKFRAFYSQENMLKIARTGETQEIENRWFIQTDGKYRWKYNKAVRMVDDSGKACVVIGVIDTTEEKERAAEQAEREKQLQNTLELANQQRHIKAFGDMVNAALWSIRIDKDDEIVGVYWSNELRHMFGFEENEEDFPNTLESWLDRISPDDKAKVLEHFNKSLKSYNTEKFVFDTEFRFMRKSDKLCWYHAAGRMENNDDGTRTMFGIAYDISAEKQLEEQQQQLEEALAMAQSANRAKTTFLNNMSHDIRTPMNAIIGFTGLAASHIDNKEMVENYLGKIGQSSNHLLSLINDVLDMSRIESGKMNLDEKEENLPDIIHTLRDIVQADIKTRQHDFFIDTVNVNDENIICDKLRLNQVLLNILSNAIKYTAAGGTISMRITEKTVKSSGYGTYEFRIKDNGMGMDEDYLKTIFDPFTRVKSSTVSGIQGTGLGMAITKNIVDMMGGTIDVISAPGKGTEMIVTFNFKLAQAHRESFAIAELDGVRGLVVDDDPNTVMSVARMIKNIGMRSDWCTSGKEAVLRAEDAYSCGDPFKVYIIDWLMPDMNGIETARRIRRVVGEDTPIIILTAYDWADIEDEAREAGVTAFVSKPLFPSDLGRVLNSCFGRIEKKETAAKEYDFTGKKVLLVEDNEMNREIATEILEEDGFIVDTAEDGTFAVEKIKQATDGDYDLILMDVQMPVMDGYEATKQIRALGTGISQIPIIAMTANAFDEDRRIALAAGMDEHISKPIDIAKLKETLAKFLK